MNCELKLLIKFLNTVERNRENLFLCLSKTVITKSRYIVTNELLMRINRYKAEVVKFC